MNKVLSGGMNMGSKYNNQLSKENTGNSYDHDMVNEQLREADTAFLTDDNIQLVGKLAAGVAHEIKNPLTSIKGFVQLLNMGINKPEYYSIIYSEIDQVEAAVNKLINLAETQSVCFRINSIARILECAVKKMNDLAERKGIRIILRANNDLLSICCDEIQLQEVFERIIKNAIEASASKRNIYITYEKNESHVHITIKDEGAGIPYEKMMHLFEPSYCNKKNCTGFGLMISRKIIKEHNGAIHIKSGLGMGTTVDICLPLQNSKVPASQQL
ncbi:MULTISPECIES: ATP-binding protein [unclassified Sporosarcina]|uniref:ATP-binding protein n=1 Tax=unclassified Sporosarcina TaxID=2647733 RepID=UPI000A19C6B7|nr:MULTISPECIES: ATP-binding protein [unclassified Sporosarcina]PID18408.1 hypothetical protein CSV62_08145 [Sporosarcina sp. P35]